MAGERILMIEDDKEMAALGGLILEKEGFVVSTANNGAAGLAVLDEQPVDLVLLDIMMEGMDGWEVLERMRADERWQHVPVIMLTARHYLEDQQETARHAGQYSSYVVKPFVVSELIQEIRNVLAAHKLERGI
jgi:DNA-binding response OmpR family regulator